MTSSYASLSELKSYMFGTQSALLVSDDDVLQRMLDASADYFDGMVGQGILSAARTETRNGDGTSAIIPYNLPIISVSALSVNAVTIDASPDAISWGYAYDRDAIYIRAPFTALMNDYAYLGMPGGTYSINNFFYDRPIRFDKGVQNVTYTYVAGYATVPVDVKQAILELALFRYRQKDHIDVRSSTSNNVTTVTYVGGEIPASVHSVICKYRRVAI